MYYVARVSRIGPSTSRRIATLAVRSVLGAGAAALVVFHAALFAGRLRDASIAEPRVAASWLGAVALVVAAALLRSRGYSLFRGRSGFAFWTVVLLLHLGFTPGAPALRAEQLLGLPLELAAGALLAATAIALGLSGTRGTAPPTLAIRPRPRARSPLALGAVPARFAPRPPPLG